MNILCFAGKDSDLVVSASTGHMLFVWSLGHEISVKQSLLALLGHTQTVLVVQYDPCNDVLGSAGQEKIIKLWTSVAQL